MTGQGHTIYILNRNNIILSNKMYQTVLKFVNIPQLFVNSYGNLTIFEVCQHQKRKTLINQSKK